MDLQHGSTHCAHTKCMEACYIHFISLLSSIVSASNLHFRLRVYLLQLLPTVAAASAVDLTAALCLVAVLWLLGALSVHRQSSGHIPVQGLPC